jgi:heat shock protein HslJ
MTYRITLLIGLSLVLWQCQPTKDNSKMDQETVLSEPDSLAKERPEGADASFLEKKSRDGVDFYAVGNEPSWSLDIFQEHMISFKSLTEVEQLNTPKVIPTNTNDPSVLSYRAEVESGSIEISIKSEECTDLMSGEQFPYHVEVRAKNGNMTDLKAFNGCGRYVPDYRLSGTWRLYSLGGVILAEQDMPNAPYITLDISDTKVTGSNGCNRIMGRFINEGETLSFPMLAGTRMACQGDLDTKVDAALNKAAKYQIEADKLIMAADGERLSTWARE